MLTREEAKTKKCPYTFVPHGIGKHGAFSEYCKAENCPKWRDSFGHKMHCKGSFFTEEEFYPPEDERCSFYHKVLSQDEMSCEIWYLGNHLERCNHCPHRYGYCGG